MRTESYKLFMENNTDIFKDKARLIIRYIVGTYCTVGRCRCVLYELYLQKHCVCQTDCLRTFVVHVPQAENGQFLDNYFSTLLLVVWHLVNHTHTRD